MFIRTGAKWLFIICLPVLLLTASTALTANSLWQYERGAQKYGVTQDLAASGLKLADNDLSNIYTDLISYFNSSEEYVNIKVLRDDQQVDLFTQEETIHFRDVKGLIWTDYWVLLGTLVYSLAFVGLSLFRWRERRLLGLGLLGGGCLTLVIMLVFVLLDWLFGFDQLWYQFHLVSFSNLFWSAQGYMLRLFPEGLFYDMVTFGAGLAIALAIILGGVGWYLAFRKSRPR